MKFVCLIAVLGCGGSPKPKAAEPASVATVPSAGAKLEPAPSLLITELEFYEGEDLGMKLHADGVLEMKHTRSDGKNPPVESWIKASISPTGDVQKDGVVAGTFKDDVFMVTGSSLPAFTLKDDALVVEGKTFKLTAEGRLDPEKPTTTRPLRVKGATNVETRRMALFVIGVISSSRVPAPPPPNDPTMDAAVTKMEGFQIRMCECKVKACADKVNDDMTAWGTEMAKQQPKGSKLSPELNKRSTDIMTKYAECMTRLMTPPKK